MQQKYNPRNSGKLGINPGTFAYILDCIASADAVRYVYKSFPWSVYFGEIHVLSCFYFY